MNLKEGEGKNKFNNLQILNKIGLEKMDIILLSILFILFFGINFNITAEMKQLPSPIYGGDYYYQMGCINHIRYGGDPFQNCNLISDNPGYFPLLGIAESPFANFFSLDSFTAEINFSFIILIFSIFISYILFRKIFGDYKIAFLGVLLFIYIGPILKYTEFATYIINPLFILLLFSFYKKQNYLNAVLLGIAAGINTIAHSVLFPATYITLMFLFLYLVLNSSIKLDKTTLRLNKTLIIKSIKKLAPFSIIIIFVSVPISMLYWYEPIFEYSINTSPHYLEWNGPGDMTSFSLQTKIFVDILKSTFSNFSSISGFIRTLFFLCGVISIFLIKEMGENIKFVIFIFLTALICTFSYFITMPLLHIHFVPNYMFKVFGKIILVCFALFGLGGLMSLLNKKIKLPNLKTILIGVFVVLLIVSNIYAVNNYKESKWYNVSLNEMDESKISLKNYVLANTEVNDVFMTTKEVGFMLNALTGRKLVCSRRAQNDAFENMDIREIEEAIILYGNNTETKKQLIEKYNIKYLYWDYYWIRSEYYFNEKGQVTGWFDPLISFKNQENIELLNQNNVSYFIKNTYVDPTKKSKYHPTFDLIFISSQNYHNFVHPWNPNLDPYLEEVWSYKQQNQKIAILYKINI